MRLKVLVFALLYHGTNICIRCQRINPYMSNPCHIEIIVSEEDAQVKKESQEKQVQRLNRRQIAQRRLLPASAQE